jgi:hypothetical protein
MTTSNPSSATTRTFSPVFIEHMGFVNLTPHPITFRDRNGFDTTIPPSGVVARIGTRSTPAFHNGEADEPHLFTQSIPGLPEGIDEFIEWAAGLVASTGGHQVMGVVSSMFLDAIPVASESPLYSSLTRGLCAPQTDGTAIRNEQGHIVAVRSFRVIKDADRMWRWPGMGGYG